MFPFLGLSLKEWALVAAIAALVGWHLWDVHASVRDAVATERGKIEGEKAQAIVQAQKEWHENSGQLDIMTELDRRNYSDKLDKITQTLGTMQRSYHEIVIKNPLPVGCVASPDRVQSVNAALGH